MQASEDAVSDREALMPIVTLALAGITLLLSACGPPQNPPASLYPELILTRAERRGEVETKAARLFAFLRKERLAGVLITGRPAFSWATAGAEGLVPLFYREDGRRYLIAHKGVDSARQLDDLSAMGFEARTLSAAGQKEMAAALQELSMGRPFGADEPCSGGRTLNREIASLRVPLTDGEMRELRWLGGKTAESVEEVCRTIRPGMTDRGIEAALIDTLQRRCIRVTALEIEPDVPVPGEDGKPRTDVSKIEHRASVNLRAERWGLKVALTRVVHFGPLSEDDKAHLKAAALVNAGFWARTLPGTDLRSILRGAVSDYAEAGFPQNWFPRSPGGPIEYGDYDGLATPDSTQTVRTPQAFAWNATVGDLRIEDTILLDGDRLEVLTETPDWPRVESPVLGKIYRSPGILTYNSPPPPQP